MIFDYLQHNYQNIIEKLFIIFFTWFVVLTAIGIDLVHGIKKSKAVGEYTHSYGLRQTIKKIINYLSMMVFMLLFDSLNPLGGMIDIFKLPLASIVGALSLVWIEFISVREKADEKFRRRTAKTTGDILEILVTDERIKKKIRDNLKNEKNEEVNESGQD